MLGIRTQGRRMVGTDKTTELWRPPKKIRDFCITILNTITDNTYTQVVNDIKLQMVVETSNFFRGLLAQKAKINRN